MRYKVDEYKGQKIWVDERGQFWTGEEGSEHFWNAGTFVQQIKDEIDFLEAYEKATPVKMLRIEYPYLQVWEARKVTYKEFGYEKTSWFTKDDVYRGPNSEKRPRRFQVGRDVVEYNEEIHAECQCRFKEIEEHHKRFEQIKEAMRIERD